MDYYKDDQVGKFDEIISQQNIKVAVDHKAVMFLVGTEMDYIEDELKAEFVFNNPNAKGHCGCGESFHI
jgi:iron-sulfur cluster assembly protein